MYTRTVNYMSLDIEGAELQILQNLPWHQVSNINGSGDSSFFIPEGGGGECGETESWSTGQVCRGKIEN
jgi:hypothetical protein